MMTSSGYLLIHTMTSSDDTARLQAPPCAPATCCRTLNSKLQTPRALLDCIASEALDSMSCSSEAVTQHTQQRWHPTTVPL
eukprot:m.18025 g.18025  ORF g.18025 m.18025 type:complete len:81 (+) comp11364_c0_seq1:3-245(+)